MVIRVVRSLRLAGRKSHSHIGGFGRFYLEKYNVTAYVTRVRTRDGVLVYWKDHNLLNGVDWETVVSKGYKNTPQGALHNRPVEEVVLARFGFDTC